MNADDSKLLPEVFCSVIEQSAFMFAKPADKKDLHSGDEKYLQSYITFSGHQTGLLSITMPEILCWDMAANILGTEPDDEFVHEQAGDAIGEMLNVLCGQFLTTVEGDEPVFNLSVPMMTTLSPEDWECLKAHETSELVTIDEHPVILHLAI